jgi:hypothetical protein
VIASPSEGAVNGLAVAPAAPSAHPSAAFPKLPFWRVIDLLVKPRSDGIRARSRELEIQHGHRHRRTVQGDNGRVDHIILAATGTDILLSTSFDLTELLPP